MEASCAYLQHPPPPVGITFMYPNHSPGCRGAAAGGARWSEWAASAAVAAQSNPLPNALRPPSHTARPTPWCQPHQVPAAVGPAVALDVLHNQVVVLACRWMAGGSRVGRRAGLGAEGGGKVGLSNWAGMHAAAGGLALMPPCSIATCLRAPTRSCCSGGRRSGSTIPVEGQAGGTRCSQQKAGGRSGDSACCRPAAHRLAKMLPFPHEARPTCCLATSASCSCREGTLISPDTTPASQRDCSAEVSTCVEGRGGEARRAKRHSQQCTRRGFNRRPLQPHKHPPMPSTHMCEAG